ncbi:MAG: hypothetical protein ACXV4B_08090, partial [Halobacteriota archaeon]
WAREIRTLGSCRAGTDSRGKKSLKRARLPKLSLYTAGIKRSNRFEPIRFLGSLGKKGAGGALVAEPCRECAEPSYGGDQELSL